MYTWIKITHEKLDNHFGDLNWVGNVEFLINAIQTYGLQAFKDTYRHLIDFMREFLKHGWVEEEPNTMWKEKVRLWCQYHEIEQILWIFHVSLQVERAQLRNKEFKIISENTCEVRIDSAFLQILNGIWLMSIHSNHRLSDPQRLLISTNLWLQIDPLVKSLDKGLLGYYFWFFTANAATKQVIEAAACSK